MIHRHFKLKQKNLVPKKASQIVQRSLVFAAARLPTQCACHIEAFLLVAEIHTSCHGSHGTMLRVELQPQHLQQIGSSLCINIRNAAGKNTIAQGATPSVKARKERHRCNQKRHRTDQHVRPILGK